MPIDSTYVLVFFQRKHYVFFGAFEPVLSGHMREVAGWPLDTERPPDTSSTE